MAERRTLSLYEQMQKENQDNDILSPRAGRKTSGVGGDVLELEAAVTEDAPSQANTEISCFLFQSQGQEPCRVNIADLPPLVEMDENFVWVDITSTVTENIQQIADLLHLNQDAVLTSLASWERPTLDMFTTHFFVTATLPRIDAVSYHIEVQKVASFVGKNFLVSIHQRALPFSLRVFQRATQNPYLIEYDSILMLFILLDELLAYYESLKEKIQDQIEMMEERALMDTSNEFLGDLLHFKRYAFALSQLASQHRIIFTGFLRPDFTQVFNQKVEVYYRDLDARHTRLEDTFLGAKDSINTIFDIYVSHVSHFTNQVMKTLTIVSTILLPTTIIISFFSTSYIQDFPPLVHVFWGFLLMLVCIFTCSSMVLWIFYRKGWL